ncbi:transcriptional regulator [Mesorhizobium sp. WSM3864]|nr:transcriptional regulator [Mesorhizobium sp. WSM3864]
MKQRYGDISEQTLWRWVKKPGTTFPQPVMRLGVRYWDEAELDRFDAALVEDSKRQVA